MATKSEQMARVRSRDTEPERRIRRLLSDRGVRYRLHRKDLPGTPDLFIGRLKAAVFVHGCFWHGHECRRGKKPASNVEFWEEKIRRNVLRDEKALRALADRGIESHVLWTCTPADFDRLADSLARRYRNAGKGSRAR